MNCSLPSRRRWRGLPRIASNAARRWKVALGLRSSGHEFEVFRLVLAGLLNKEIGAELGVTLRTIKTHRARVMQKIGVISVAELVRLAQKAGVAPAEHV